MNAAKHCLPTPRTGRSGSPAIRWSAVAGRTLSIGLLLTAPWAAVAQDRAAEVQQKISEALTFIEASSLGTLAIKTSQPPQVTPAGEAMQVTLPDLVIAFQDGDPADLSLGTVTLVQEVVGPDRWRLSGDLPQSFMFVEPGEAPLPVTMASASFSWDFHPSNAFTYASSLSISEAVTEIDGGTLSLEGLNLRSDLQETADQSWVVPFELAMTGLRATPPNAATDMVRLDTLAMVGDLQGTGVDRLLALQESINQIAPDGSNALPLLFQMFGQLTQPAFLFSDMQGRIEIAGLAVNDEFGGPMGSLERGSLYGSITGFDTDASRIEIGYGHTNLALPMIDGEEISVPPVTELAIGLGNLPVATAIRIAEGLLTGQVPPEAMADPEAYAMRLLSDAGASFEIARLHVDDGTSAVMANGAVTMDSASPYSVVGTLALGIRGLEELAATAAEAADDELSPAEVALIGALGEREDTPDGLVRHYRLALDQAGRVFLNDNDVTPAVEELVAEMAEEEAPIEPPQPVAEAPAAPAGVLTSVSPSLFVEEFQNRGMEASAGTNSRGEPYLEVVTGGPGLPVTQLLVEFFGCDADGECPDAMVWSWFTPAAGTDEAAVNGWNARSRWTRAYMDSDRDVRLEMDIRAAGGLGRDALSGLMTTYLEMVPAIVGNLSN